MNNTDHDKTISKDTNPSAHANTSRNANQIYYQQMYDKIHASKALQERLIDMYKMNADNNTWMQHKTTSKKGVRRNTWKVAAAVAALSIVIPTGVYAANHYFGIADFFSQTGQELSEDANKLIETDIVQIPDKETAAKIPVTFTVQEALCDSGTVNIVVQAKANESGKYLLVPQDALETDSMENLGLDSTQTISEYAKEKNLEILYVNSGFKVGSPFFPGVCSGYTKSIQDDILAIGITAEREADDTELDVLFENAVWKSGSEDIIKTTSSFQLQDSSSSKVVSYKANGSMEVPGTSAIVTNVEMEKTEVHTYVTVYYTNKQADWDDGMTFRIKDSRNENTWQLSTGSGVEDLGNGNYRQRMTYDAIDFPDQCILEAFDCWEKNIYGQFEISRAD